jgi:curved DNA-binding protein CbpA
VVVEDYYKLLKVPQNATQDEIKKAFVDEVRKYHPDVYSGDKAFAEKQTIALTEAYNVLKDENSRKKYDKKFARSGTIYGTSVGDISQDGNIKEESIIVTPKPKKRSIFGKIFRSKFLYILLFLITIEVILYILFLK